MSAQAGAPAALSGIRRTDFAHAALVNIGVTALTVVVGLIVARHYPPAAYGRLAYFTAVFGGFRLLTMLGLTSQIIIELSRIRDGGVAAETVFYPLLVLRTATLAVLTVVMLAVGGWLGDPVLTGAALTACIALLSDYLVGALQGLGAVRAALAAQCLQPLGYALGALAAVVCAAPIEAVFVVLFASFAAVALASALSLARRLRRPAWRELRVGQLRERFGSAGGMYLMGLLGTAYTSSATFALGSVERFTEAAQLAVPLYMVTIVGILTTTVVNTVYFPQLVTLAARRDQAQAARLFGWFSRYVVAAAVLLAAVLLLFPQTVLTLLYGGRYAISTELLRLAAPVALLYTVQGVLAPTIVAWRGARAALTGSAISAAVVLTALGLDLLAGLPLAGLAAAHTLGALAGALYQWRTLDLAEPRLLRGYLALAWPGVAGVALLATLVPDSGTAPLPAAVCLAALTAAYGAWVWRRLRAPEVQP